MRREAKILKEALPLYNAKHIIISEVKDLVLTYQIQLPFKTKDNEQIIVYAYQKPKWKKLYLTDAGRVVRSLEKLGVGIVMPVLQNILREYGLRLDEHASIIEDSDRPLGERLSSVIEAYIAVDGISRGWIATEAWKEELKDVRKTI